MVKIIIISFISIAALAACNYHVDKTGTGGENTLAIPRDSSELNFAIIKSNILKPRCYECHSSTGRNMQPLLDEYSAVIANLKDIEADVGTDRMPLRRSPLTAAEKEALAQWIAAGAPETVAGAPQPKPEPKPEPTPEPTPTPTPTPTPPPVGEAKLDYATVHARVIEPMCLRCHTQPKPRAGVSLDTYENVKKNLAGVKEQIETGMMPPRDSLTAEQLSLLTNWINAGAPEVEAPVPAPTPTPTPTPQPAPAPEPPAPAPTEPQLDYATVYSQVIEPMCLRCHTQPKPRAGVSLDTYENTLKNISGIQEQVEQGMMPPRDSLTPEQMNLLLNWIKAGAPQTGATPKSLRKCDEQNLTKAFVQFVTNKVGETQDNCVK